MLSCAAQYCVLVRAAALAGCHSAADAAADAALLVRHLKTRSMALKTGVFGVVRALVAAAGAQGFHAAAVVPYAEAALRDESSSNAVKAEVLLFLQAALVPAAAADVAPLLPALAGGLQSAVDDKYYKVCALLFLFAPRSRYDPVFVVALLTSELAGATHRICAARCALYGPSSFVLMDASPWVPAPAVRQPALPQKRVIRLGA